MAIEKTALSREFTFKKDNEKITLPDPNKEFSVQEVMQFYSNRYPELTTAIMTGPVIVGRTAVYSVKTTVGTKG